MRKLFFTSLILFFLVGIKAQNLNFESVQKEIKASFPEINFSDKLLVLSVWNSKDVSSREMNKEMLRVYNIYLGAKLKDGIKGLVFVSFSSDDSEINHNICLVKEFNNYPYNICDYKGFSKQSKLTKLGITNMFSNCVFNSKGNLIYQNLETNSIYKSFNLLLTR